MKFFELKMRVIAPLVLMCCLIGAGSQVAQAQSRSLWLGNDTGGDVFQTTTTGSVITDLTNLPTTGIAWDGTNLYFANPSGFFTKRTADGMTVLDSFTITPSTGGGEDLAWDSNRKVLWRILHNPAALQKIDPVSKTLIASYAIPNSDPGFLGTLGGLGIAYDSTRVVLDVSFCSAGCSSLAAGLVDRVDPNTGNVLGQLFRTSGFATGGLAYDLGTDTLWVGDSSVVRNMDRSGNVISSFSRPSPGGFVDGLELQTQTMYTNDTNIADFTSDISMYATFSNFSNADGCATSPFTPTSAELAGPNACRVYTGTLSAGLPAGNNWILATFPSPVSSIVVFPNIDHFGSPYDGYQYQIYGSNNYGSEFPTWAPLFDATSVNGTGEPFTLGTFTGTAPSSVNNVLTPGAGPGGTVGYIAQFQFGTAYQYYALGASTVAFAQGNPDQELSAVGATSSFTTPPQTLTEGQTNNVTFTDGNKINQNVVIQSAILGNTKSMAVK